ncbi:reverse transcriptase domain-containing protein [Tanacetum coccineum]
MSKFPSAVTVVARGEVVEVESGTSIDIVVRGLNHCVQMSFFDIKERGLKCVVQTSSDINHVFCMTSDVLPTLPFYTAWKPGRAFWGADDEEVSEGGIHWSSLLGYEGTSRSKPVCPTVHRLHCQVQRSTDTTCSSGDDAMMRNEEEEEEGHLAPADSATFIPTDEPVFPPEGTELLYHPSTDITIGARITVRPQTSNIPSIEAELLLVLPPPPTTTHYTPSLYIPHLVDHMDVIPESEQPPAERVGYGIRNFTSVDPAGLEAVPGDANMTVDKRSSLGSESIWTRSGLTSLLIRDRIDSFRRQLDGRGGCLMLPRGLGSFVIVLSQHHQELQTHSCNHVYAHEDYLQDTRPQLQHAERQDQMVEALRVIRDMRREMSDMQTELLALREPQRRARQPGPEARIPDHQDASGDADNLDNNHGQPTTEEDQIPLSMSQTKHMDPEFFQAMIDKLSCETPPIEMEATVRTGITEGTTSNSLPHLPLLLGAALTWWNGQIRTLGPEAYAMTWEVLKKKMTDKYCPQGEIKKLEIELWNLKVKGNDVPAYTECFQELTLICTKFVADETEKVDKYISGLLTPFMGNVHICQDQELDETI